MHGIPKPVTECPNQAYAWSHICEADTGTLGLGVVPSQAMTCAISADHHGWPIFCSELGGGEKKGWQKTMVVFYVLGRRNYRWIKKKNGNRQQWD